MLSKLVIVDKKESLQALGGNFFPPPLTFSPKGEIIRNLPSLLYTQVFIVAITLGHSM